jgi:hypothetical protein
LGGSGAQVGRHLKDRHLKHEMRQKGTAHPANDLHHHKQQRQLHRYLSADEKGQRYRRIEMRTGDRSKNRDQHIKDSACWNGIAKQRDSDVSTGQPFSHDPGSDHRCQQQHRASKFGNKLARYCHGL